MNSLSPGKCAEMGGKEDFNVKHHCMAPNALRLEKEAPKAAALALSPVANAIKLLQACIYKSVNIGIFLTPSVAKSIV